MWVHLGAAGLASQRAARRAPRESRTVRDELLFSLPVARGLAFFALSAWGALHWMSMLQPSAAGRGWALVAVGLLAEFGLLAAGRLGGRARSLAATGVIVVLAFLAA